MSGEQRARPCTLFIGGDPVATGNLVINEPPEEEPDTYDGLWRNEPLELNWTSGAQPGHPRGIMQYIMRQVFRADAWVVSQRRLPRRKKKQLKKRLEKESGCKIKIRYTHKNEQWLWIEKITK